MAEILQKNDVQSISSALKLLVAYSDTSDDESDVEPELQLPVFHVRRDVSSSDFDKAAKVPVNKGEKGVSAIGSEKSAEIQIIEEDRRSVSSFDSESDSDSSSSSSSAESSSSSSSESDASDSDALEEDGLHDDVLVKRDHNKTNSKNRPKKSGNELGLEDLPPIQDLHISIPKTEVLQIGSVLTIVDCLVTIQTLAGFPALDLDTMLFYESGDSFGLVFDVFGPVKQPFYVVRFNSKDDVLKKNISVKMPVYFAPKKQEYTAFVFTDQLRRMKGCDASWLNDSEPPEGHLEYSDDEEERLIKKQSKAGRLQDNEDHQYSATNELTEMETTRKTPHNWSSNKNAGPRQGRCHNRPPPSCIRPPVFNYQPNPAPATSSTCVQMPHFPPSFSPSQQHRFPVNFPPPPLPGQCMLPPRFFPHDQHQSNTGYPYQPACYKNVQPPNLTIPPPPLPLATGTFNVRLEAKDPSTTQYSAVLPFGVTTTPIGSSVEKGDLLPNPFRESAQIGAKPQGLDGAVSNSNVPLPSLYTVSPLETCAVPMFPPSGFMPKSSSSYSS